MEIKIIIFYFTISGAVNSNDAVMELLLIINSCRLASAESITVITPYFPYSKGDQKSSLRSPITAKLLANMFQKAGAHHLMMLDAHSPQIEGFFDHPVDCLKVNNMIVLLMVSFLSLVSESSNLILVL